MFVDDLKGEFYSKIKGKRVLIVVNYDVDAICACKILQSLFKTDYTLYTLVPVDVSSDLRDVIRENRLNEEFVVFINCGGTIDLVEELVPDEDITFYVLDSHRPLDVCNVYNPSQVKLLSKSDQPVPDFQDIFSDDSEEEDGESNRDEVEEEEEEEEEGSDVESQQSKRRRLNEEAVLKRRKKRIWEQRRDNLLFNYTKFSYYGRSSALIMYELAWKMSKDSFDLLWYAIVGLSEQLLMRKIGEQDYVAECGDVQNHVARLTHRSAQASEAQASRNTGVRIEFERDLRLALMRHWTVKSSLTYSAFTATRLNLWTFQGEKRLHEMLAEIGIPLAQCNQKFAAMDLVFRKEFQESLERMSKKYSLDGIALVSFLMQHGFRAKYSAMDFVYGLIALLQSCGEEKSKADCFFECLEALCRKKKEKLDRGIDSAKKMLVSVFKQVQNALETKQIQSAGPFLYLVVQEGNADAMLCNHPYGIFLLAEFALRAFACSSKGSRFRSLPLVISTPVRRRNKAAAAAAAAVVAGDEDEGLCHVTGIAPYCHDNNTNFFGRAFKKAAETSLSAIRDSYFDSSVILLNVKDRTRFLDALAVLLNDD